MFKWIWRIFILVLVLGGGLFFFANGLQDTSLEGFMITGISQIDMAGFIFDAELTLNNPSRLPIPVSDITYNATLERTQEQIGSGDFNTFILQPGESTAELDQRIEWVPTVRTAAELATQEEVWVRIDGIVRIDVPMIEEMSFSFTDRVDIKRELQEYANQVNPLETSTENPGGLLESFT